MDSIHFKSGPRAALQKFVRTTLLLLRSIITGNLDFNGKRLFVTLGDVFQKYQNLHIPTVTEATRVKLIGRVNRSLVPFFDTPIALMTPETVARMLKSLKEGYTQSACSKRFTFLKELKDLRSALSWWTDNFDYRFSNPVRKFHSSLAVMEEIPEKDKKISMQETLLFFKALGEKTLYQDVAVSAFWCGGRIGEITGIQVKNIDFENRILKIKEVISYVSGRPTLKLVPKNGKPRSVYLNETLMEIFTRRIKQVPPGCPFLFHDGETGRPLRYGRINKNFNDAWKKCGLGGKFSGAHLMRYASAQAARMVTGSLDAAAAVTGHGSAMAAHYAKLDFVALNQSSLIEMEKRIEELKAA